MTESTIKIPDSVLSYMNNESVRTAVDNLLGKKDAEKKIPNDITTWAEARGYHRALLSAYQVRSEFAIFLFDLMDAVWGEVIASHKPKCKIIEYKQQHSEEGGYAELTPSVTKLFAYEIWLCRTIKHPNWPNNIVETSICWESKLSGITLAFSVVPDGKHSNEENDFSLENCKNWKFNEEGYWETLTGTFIPEQINFSTKELVTAANAALDAIS